MMGVGAGIASVDVNNTVIIGYAANNSGNMEDAASGTVSIGYLAGNAITSAVGNVSVGERAGNALSLSGYNVAIGREALEAETTGQGNVAIGYQALHIANQGGGSAVNAKNTIVGFQGGDGIEDGAYNTGIGAETAFDVDADNQTALGYQATTAPNGANTVKIGNGSVSASHIQVDWTIDSDSRIKKDIKESDIGLSFINALKPRKYKRRHPSEWDSTILEKRYKKGGSNYDDDKDEVIKDEFDDNKTWDGLIAQEVKEVIDKSGTTFSGWSEDGDGKQGIQYSSLVVPLIKAVQELSAKVTELESKLK
jgi:hypothetical protein